MDLKLSTMIPVNNQASPRLTNKKQELNFHFAAYFPLDKEWEFIIDSTRDNAWLTLKKSNFF